MLFDLPEPMTRRGRGEAVVVSRGEGRGGGEEERGDSGCEEEKGVLVGEWGGVIFGVSLS